MVSVAGPLHLSGSLDETRVSSTARSANWLVTGYRNQNNPSTFFTFGPEITVGPQTIALTGIPSREAFGASPTITTSVTLSLTGIPSAEAFGAVGLTVTESDIVLGLTGIPSAEAFGVPTLSASRNLALTGIPSAAVFGRVLVRMSQVVPILTWVAPDPITEGTPLGFAQLRARSVVPGTFSYNPPVGSVLAAGTQTLSVSFTPNDKIAYTTASLSVQIQVEGAAQVNTPVFPLNLRYRRLDANGDFMLTGTGADYHRNTPAAVAQCVATRLKLFAGEYFLDLNEGTPWKTGVLGKGTRDTYTQVIKDRILGTPGVTEIVSFSSSIDPTERSLTVEVTINTLYGGQVSLSIALSPSTAAPLNLADNGSQASVQPPPSMKYRKLDAKGDYTLTSTGSDYWVSSPAGVAQAVKTRLALWRGTWFLDNTAGVPYSQSILTKNSRQYDAILKDAILNTTGVTGISNYSSTLNPTTRKLSVNVTISTLYGQATVQTIL